MTTSAAILCEPLGPPVRERRPLSPRAWTCVGVLSIPLWATWPALALRALEMPAFECLTIAFLFGWIALRFTRRMTEAGDSAHSQHSTWLSWVPAPGDRGVRSGAWVRWQHFARGGGREGGRQEKKWSSTFVFIHFGDPQYRRMSLVMPGFSSHSHSSAPVFRVWTFSCLCMPSAKFKFVLAVRA